MTNRRHREDYNALNANIAEKQFADKYPDFVKDVHRKFIDYIKVLTQARTVIPATAGTSTPAELETVNGYPKVPQFLVKNKITKDQAEGVLRGYLTAGYSG